MGDGHLGTSGQVGRTKPGMSRENIGQSYPGRVGLKSNRVTQAPWPAPYPVNTEGDFLVSLAFCIHGGGLATVSNEEILAINVNHEGLRVAITHTLRTCRG